ncbi:13166_t:CDS:2, partial [Acaulospora morrowiae]
NVKGFPGLGQSNTLFQFMNRIVIAIWALVLILSEVGWPRRIFMWFPMLDETHSWACFGLLQMIIGSLILGYDSGINSIDFLGYSTRLVRVRNWNNLCVPWIIRRHFAKGGSPDYHEFGKITSPVLHLNVKGFPGLGQSNIFFQFVNRIVIVIWAFVLILSEIGWPKRIHKWFPILDDSHGWVCFGLLQIIMGSLILGHDSGINSIDFLGYGLHVFIVVPGWFVFVIGIIYVLLGSFGGASLKADRRIV